MLKLTVKAGEYVLIGDQVKVVYTGGSGENAHILVDAPKSMNIVRSGVLEKIWDGGGSRERSRTS